MKKYYLLPALFMMITAILSAQKEGLETINQTDLKANMEFFASDAMRGRETGSHENDIAALFLKANIMKLGLKTIPGTGDYLQKVPLISSEIKRGETYIRESDNKGEQLFSTDSIIYLMAPYQTLESSSDFVYAGYGYEDSTTGYNDFRDIDIKDKVIMIMTGSPDETNPETINSFFDMGTERPKIMNAFKNGVRAILYVYDPRSKFSDAYASGLAEMGAGSVGTKMITPKSEDKPSPVQIGFITRYAADQLLKKSGKNVRALQEKIIADKKPVSFELSDVSITFRTFIEQGDINPVNVIGILEGSDPVLKNECVIYTAHFDHIGVNKNGDVFNGADDNASGSMALLEIAQAFTNLKKKPLRTIIFAWVNGEEKGLYGSQYYANNPVFSMDKTLMDINLDMVGRSRMPSDTGKFMGYDINVSGKGEIQLFTDQKGSDILDLISSTSKTAGIKVINMGKDPMLGSSDYASFMEKGVPAIFFNSGDYPDLHTIRDDVDKIDFDKMERVSKMVFLIGYNIGNEKKRFVPDTIK